MSATVDPGLKESTSKTSSPERLPSTFRTNLIVY